MSDLLPSLIPLDKGLNLQTAKLVAPAGSVLDSLNYEQVDFQGQKRIEGFTRYDGRLSAAVDEYYRITTDNYAWDRGSDALAVEGGIFARDVTAGTPSADNVVYAVIINENLIPKVGDTIYAMYGDTRDSSAVVTAIGKGVDVVHSVDGHYNNLLMSSTALRESTTSLPGPIIGLHWFRDRLYAVADVITISLEGTSPLIYPNDILAGEGDGYGPEAKVLDSYIKANSRIVYLAGTDTMPWEWYGSGAAVARLNTGGEHIGTTTDGYDPVLASEEIASFFESRSEIQTITEDADSGNFQFGWRFIDHGWKVNFGTGISLYGSLPSLNQNIKGLGIQGPTSVTGDNGRPLVVSQKVSITNEQTQVNGWKNSQTPTSYALESDNLIDIDGDTIYADAYISWDGSTGVVTGLTDTLTEYAASSTVVIEI